MSLTTATEQKSHVERKAMADGIVRLSAVSKAYGRGDSAVAALTEVSIDVAVGEFVCFVGASGCGKSTLLSLVAGLDQPSSGEVHTGDRQIAFMFQEPALFPWLTAAGNIDLALRARKVPRDQRRSRVAELLAVVGLAEFRQCPPTPAVRRNAPACRSGTRVGTRRRRPADGRTVRRTRRDHPQSAAR